MPYLTALHVASELSRTQHQASSTSRKQGCWMTARGFVEATLKLKRTASKRSWQ